MEHAVQIIGGPGLDPYLQWSHKLSVRMTAPDLWLIAIVLEILGILFIGDDAITTRRDTKAARSSRIAEDGSTDRAAISIAMRHNPWKPVLGIALLLAGLGLALVANQI